MADLTNLFNALGIAEKHEANCTKFNDVPVNNQFRCSHNKINKTLAGESKYSQPLSTGFQSLMKSVQRLTISSQVICEMTIVDTRVPFIRATLE